MTNGKIELLRQFAEWNSFVTELGRYDDRIWNQSVAVGKWSVREVVAHILRWDDYFYEEAIAKIGANEPLTVKHLDYDEFNTASKAYGKATAPSVLVQQAVESRNRIIELLSHLSKDKYEKTYQDADGHPFQPAQYMIDFIWHDQHHIAQINCSLHARIEEISLNGWPALQTIVYDGWLLRFADGYTKRSNSVSPIYGHTHELTAKISACEQLYEQQQICPVFKITPFIQPASLDAHLEGAGYKLIDHSLVKTIHLDDVKEPLHSEVWLEESLSESWLDTMSIFGRLTEEQRAITRKMMEQSPLMKCFAVLHNNGIPVACGIAVIEDGWIGLYDIVTDPDYRNRGFGEQLVLHLLQWGKQMGATEGYLLVVKDNTAANKLYDKIGYKYQYDYWYRAKAK